jgi:hypothetical protein
MHRDGAVSQFASLLHGQEMPRASIGCFPLAFSFPKNPYLFVLSLVALFKVTGIGGFGANG